MHSQFVNKIKSITEIVACKNVVCLHNNGQFKIHKMMSKTNFCTNLEWCYQHISGKSLVNMHVIHAQTPQKSSIYDNPFQTKTILFYIWNIDILITMNFVRVSFRKKNYVYCKICITYIMNISKIFLGTCVP